MMCYDLEYKGEMYAVVNDEIRQNEKQPNKVVARFALARKKDGKRFSLAMEIDSAPKKQGISAMNMLVQMNIASVTLSTLSNFKQKALSGEIAFLPFDSVLIFGRVGLSDPALSDCTSVVLREGC